MPVRSWNTFASNCRYVIGENTIDHGRSVKYVFNGRESRCSSLDLKYVFHDIVSQDFPQNRYFVVD